MNLTDVRWFLTVAELGNVTRAARALFVSQPGLSRGIARLEADLGVRLFVRAGRSLRLSRYGVLFRDHAMRLLADDEAARRALAQAADAESGEVALAFLHTLGTRLVPDLIRGYRQRRPRVSFRLSQHGADAVASAVSEGRADLGLIGPRPGGPRLAWHLLTVERLYMVVPAAHRLASRRRIGLSEVADEQFVGLRPGYGLRAIVDELFRRAGIQPRIAFEGEEVSTLRGLVGAGLGVAIVPAPRRGAAGDVAPVRHVALAEPAARREIGLIWAAGRELAPVVDAFRRFVIEPQGLSR